MCALCAGASPARAEGWVEALSELKLAPSELADARRPLSERIAYARTLGAYGEAEDAVQSLVRALDAKLEPELREEILLALARRAPASAGKVLAALLEHEGAGQGALMTALSAIATEESLAALTRALAQPKAAALAERALLDAGSRAAPLLAQAVTSPLALRAARMLGQLGPAVASFALPALLRALHSESRELRATAAEALGRLEDPRAAKPLCGLLRDRSPAVVSAALAALARTATPAEAWTLAAFFERAPPTVRGLALSALARAAPERALVPLEQALFGNDRGLHDAALAALEGETPAPAFVPLLARYFEAELHEATASALARIPDGRGLEGLLRAAQRSPDAAEVAARALALGVRRFGAVVNGALVHETHALLRSLEAGERRLVLEGLARDPAALDQGIAALASSVEGERASAALALGALGDARAASALLAALEREREPEAARRMAEAASALELRPPLATLWPLLRKPETAPEAMWLAASASDPNLPDLRLRLFLREMLRAEQPTRTRAWAALALARLGDRAARAALDDALDDASPRLRLAAAHALASLGGPAAARALVVRARVESEPKLREALREAAASDGAALPLAPKGALAIEARIRAASPRAPRALFDVLLPDGRWLRMRALPEGELIVPDLPAGEADVRAVD